MFALTSQFNSNSLPAPLLQRYSSADSAALKTAIFLLQNGEADVQQLCLTFGFSSEVALRSLQFWQAAGLITETDDKASAVTKTAEPPLQPAKRHISHTDMASAVLGDPAMAALLQETQRLLGKQLSVSESRLLFELASEHEMPAAVLLLLVSYWSGTAPQKKVLTETARTAKEWAELDIRSVETAEHQLQLMETRRSRHSSIAKLLGRADDDLTRSERKRIDEWFEQYGYDEAFVSEVLLRKADAGIPYIHSALKDWHKKGYRSISDTRTTPINIQPEAAVPQNSEGGSLLQRAAARNKRKENG